MKIAFIVDQFPAPSQTFVLRQITGLMDRGHDVDVFAWGFGAPVHEDVEKYRLLDRTRYLDLYGSSNKPLRWLKRLGLLIANFHKHPRPVSRSLNILRFGKEAVLLQVLNQIVPFLGKGPYDIVHCQFGPLGELGLLLRDTGVFQGKIVTSFRGYDISSHVKLYGKDVYRDLFQRGDLFLCVSDRIKGKLIELGCPERKVVVHRSGIDTTRDGPQWLRPSGAARVKIVTVARLVEKKGLEYAIRAVARVLPKYPTIEYQIAGDGPLRQRLEDLIRKLAPGDRIKLLGWKTEGEIRTFLEQADILLAPSITTEGGDEEGIPGAIMEAFAHGLPVISTAHAGIPEIVRDGESGFLVPERDVAAVAEKLEYLAARPKLRTIMGRNARKFVEQYYDIQMLNDRLVDLYSRLIQGKLARSRSEPAQHYPLPAHPSCRASISE